MNKLAHALLWAERGWRVFPCIPGTKEPATDHAVKDATQDASQIISWWAENEDYNIGGTRGLIIDCDLKGGANGEVAFRAWLEAKGLDGDAVIKSARRHRTPGGGLHVIFDTAEELGQPDLIKGLVNIRTENMGYVCLPGSTIDKYGGRGYTVENDVEPPPAPGPLVLLCRKTERKVAQVDNPELDKPAVVARARHFVMKADPSIQGQGGDNNAYKVAVEALDMGISPMTCLELMLEHFNPRCVPPDVDWITRKVANAVAYRQNDLGASNLGIDGWAPGTLAMVEFARQRPVRGYEAGPDDDDGDEPPVLTKAGALFRSTAELFTMPRPPEMVEGLITEQSITILFGAAKAGKSQLALDMALHIATGADTWAGMKLRKGTGPVVFCTGEGNAYLGSRFRAWCRHHGVTDPIPEERFEWVDFVPKLGQEISGRTADVLRGVKKRRARLLVLDTLEMGTVDVVDMKEAVKFMEVARWLVELAGCAILIVHHENNEEDARGSKVYKHQADGTLRLEAPDKLQPERLLWSGVHRAVRGLGSTPKGFTITENGPADDRDVLMVYTSEPEKRAQDKAARDAAAADRELSRRRQYIPVFDEFLSKTTESFYSSGHTSSFVKLCEDVRDIMIQRGADETELMPAGPLRSESTMANCLQRTWTKAGRPGEPHLEKYVRASNKSGASELGPPLAPALDLKPKPKGDTDDDVDDEAGDGATERE